MKHMSAALLTLALAFAPHAPGAAAPIDRQMKADMTAHQFTWACYINRLPPEPLPFAECESFVLGILSGVRHLQDAGRVSDGLVTRCNWLEFRSDKELARWVMAEWRQRMSNSHPSVMGDYAVAGVILNIILAC